MRINKLLAAALACVVIGSSLTWGQCDTWTSSTIRNCNGIDYELWNQNNSGTVTMKITGGSSNPNGGTFEASWRGTENVLFRGGKKWGASSTTTPGSLGNTTLDFAATWSSGDNVKMLGVYGWAYYPAGSVPTKRENGQTESFSNQIEYYMIQDRGSYNPASAGKKYGEATIDGIVYEFWTADRINQPMLTGQGNFKQYFSVPKSTSSHRQSGKISVSKHFDAWDKAGMKMMNCRLYEIAMKVESYTGAAKNSNGSANVTKNLLTFGSSSIISGHSVIAARGSTPLVSVKGRTLNVLPVEGSKLQLRVGDVRGKVRANFTAAGPVAFSLSTIPAGWYFVDVTGTGVKQFTSIVLK
ncbi:MAG: glycoside hydrolase family 11 protein [Chitinispirillaceae bacterium]|nr:glycoside hydrolase family 11 protein [Chitinispirillaceae bacterium]